MDAIESHTSLYSDEKRREAIAAYATTGVMTRVAELVNIPVSTLYGWRKCEWWETLLTRIRDEKADELDAMLTENIHLAGEQIKDRLTDGDYLVSKDGALKRKPVGARDLALVQAISFDKRALGRNQPTSISGNSKDELKKLQDQFQALAGKTVEGERIE